MLWLRPPVPGAASRSRIELPEKSRPRAVYHSQSPRAATARSEPAGVEKAHIEEGSAAMHPTRADGAEEAISGDSCRRLVSLAHHRRALGAVAERPSKVLLNHKVKGGQQRPMQDWQRRLGKIHAAEASAQRGRESRSARRRGLASRVGKAEGWQSRSGWTEARRSSSGRAGSNRKVERGSRPADALCVGAEHIVAEHHRPRYVVPLLCPHQEHCAHNENTRSARRRGLAIKVGDSRVGTKQRVGKAEGWQSSRAGLALTVTRPEVPLWQPWVVVPEGCPGASVEAVAPLKLLAERSCREDPEVLQPKPTEIRDQIQQEVRSLVPVSARVL